MTREPAPAHRVGLPGYVQRDWEVVDYDCFRLDGTDLWFRGPQPDLDTDRGHVTVLGAAQSFGCFVDEPYPALLGSAMQSTTLNLGYPGAGPAFFLRHVELIESANAGRVCIVQAMSGRSTSNSAFDNPHGLAVGRRASDGRPMAAEDVFRELLTGSQRSVPLIPRRVLQTTLRATRLPIPSVRRVVEESRRQWVSDMSRLLDRLTVPTVLLWFSERRPAYRPRYHTTSALLGDFPHLVDDAMIASVRERADHYVEVVTNRGRPHRLVSRFTGEPTTVDLSDDRKELEPGEGERTSLYAGTWDENVYYPTPEMHRDAATALAPTCRRLLAAETGDEA